MADGGAAPRAPRGDDPTTVTMAAVLPSSSMRRWRLGPGKVPKTTSDCTAAATASSAPGSSRRALFIIPGYASR